MGTVRKYEQSTLWSASSMRSCVCWRQRIRTWTRQITWHPLRTPCMSNTVWNWLRSHREGMPSRLCDPIDAGYRTIVRTNREGGSSHDVGIRALGISTHQNARPSTNRPIVIGSFAVLFLWYPQSYSTFVRYAYSVSRCDSWSRYTFSIEHVPGKYLYRADALSCAPLRGTIDGRSKKFQLEVNWHVNAVLVPLPASDRKLVEIIREVAKKTTL